MVGRTASPVPMGGYAQSNAAKGSQAVAASKKAVEASGATSGGDHEAHSRAASAHYDAAASHRDAGNGTKADAHMKQAKVHDEKASAGYRAKDFAEGEGRAAEALSKKAEMSGFGPDDKDPRKEHELHADAAQAHDRARQAYELAGCDRESKYHAAKADAHVGAHNASKTNATK